MQGPRTRQTRHLILFHTSCIVSTWLEQSHAMAASAAGDVSHRQGWCGLCRRSCTLFACICQEDMLFHTVYTLFVTFSKRLLRTCLSILGSMFRKREQFWKEHGIHLNFWFWFQHDSLRLSLRWIAKVEIHPLWFSGFPICHCSFVIQSKKHLASTACKSVSKNLLGSKCEVEIHCISLRMFFRVVKIGGRHRWFK